MSVIDVVPAVGCFHVYSGDEYIGDVDHVDGDPWFYPYLAGGYPLPETRTRDAAVNVIVNQHRSIIDPVDLVENERGW